MDKTHFKARWLALAVALGTSSQTWSAANLPEFSAATFNPGAAITHTYFPMHNGLTRIFEGAYEDEGELVTERFELTWVGAGPTLLGVPTQTRLDRAFEDGVLVEETFDYYAQDNDGNVWYFGEDVVNYRYDDDGNFLGTDTASAWLSGENSALPGFALPASLDAGFEYYQEFAPFDAALDIGQTLASDRELSVGGIDYSNVLAVLETSGSEPEAREIKYYAPGVGLIAVDEGLSADLQETAFRVEFAGTTPVPLPAPVALLGSAIAGLLVSGRRLRCAA